MVAQAEIFCSISSDILPRKFADFQIDCYVMLKGHITLSGKYLTFTGSKGFSQKSQPYVMSMGLQRFCASTCNLSWGNCDQIFHFWVGTYIWKTSSINGYTYPKNGYPKRRQIKHCNTARKYCIKKIQSDKSKTNKLNSQRILTFKPAVLTFRAISKKFLKMEGVGSA